MHNKKRIIYIFESLILVFIIIFSVINIAIRIRDNNIIENEINYINKTVIIETIDGTNNSIEIINQEKNIPPNDPYWDYIKTDLINVDFNDLKKINNEAVGWISISGTSINYPFVQTKDNNYYLRHSFDKNYNRGGWIFLDYRNNPTNFNKNTIIYGHARYNKTLFGTLKNTLTKKWVDNINNHIIRISTEMENTLWKVFSIYHLPTTTDYTKIDFNSNNDFMDFIDMIVNRSYYNFNVNINENDQILTISTCYNKTEKLVVHAVLIKKETRY